MALQKDALVLEVTTSTSDLLHSLGEQLAFIEAHVSPLLTPPIFEAICEKVDILFVGEVGNQLDSQQTSNLREFVSCFKYQPQSSDWLSTSSSPSRL